MPSSIKIGDRVVGSGHPTYIVAEIGINHNGDIVNTLKLIDAASLAGCDAVKFQKRVPELCVPPDQRNNMRDTPWGRITYLEYRHKVELSREDYEIIDQHCREKHIAWFASCWDLPSVDFIEDFNPPCHKIASACLTNDRLLERIRSTGRPMVLSTGMSSIEEIRHAIAVIGCENLLITHSTSAYPCAPHELNLRVIRALGEEFDCPIGYSGHEVGLQTTYAAVVLGACFVERHITLDRAMWGSDQAASVELSGFFRLVRDIRVIEQSLGDGIKRVYDSELPIRNRLRWMPVAS
jgi:N-acetylneuraminate synthase